MKTSFLSLTLVLTVSLSAQTVDVAPATPVAKSLRALVEADASDMHADLRNFYGPIGYRPVWTRNDRPTPQALAVAAELQNAAAKGLSAADYATLPLNNNAAAYDVALSASAMRYASHVSVGRVNPLRVGFELDANAKKPYLPAILTQLANANDPAALLASLEPQHEDYRRLLVALAKYRRVAAESANDAPLPVVAKLAPKDNYDALPQLATILRHHGDFDGTVNGTMYDGAIVDAVKKFQSRHGLAADGVISSKTFAQLNTPATYRVAQIEWALERWRWTPQRVEGPSIVVNIPEFTLRARNENDEELTMRVVVGKAAGHKTPVFDADIKHVVFRPYWSVPPNIQRGEIAPKVERDASYLARNNYEVVDANGQPVAIDADTARRIRNGSLTVRQKPGSSNALGLVKFLFPNDNNVYLHSTPQQSLFARTRRDFSHGCIRVEDPVALAEWTLRDKKEWSKEKIEAAIHGKRDDVYVKIERPITVMILYTTAVATPNGEVRFLEDIYGHDTELANALAPQQPKGGAVMLAAAR
ncbi:MAG TPA: L,D-transpeptidase family protein [Thermoanaerobaculia bacterium]|nr:L,D-transpeptidase family protein [Thermoanaerobaculia bacterium]